MSVNITKNKDKKNERSCHFLPMIYGKLRWWTFCGICDLWNVSYSVFHRRECVQETGLCECCGNWTGHFSSSLMDSWKRTFQARTVKCVYTLKQKKIFDVLFFLKNLRGTLSSEPFYPCYGLSSNLFALWFSMCWLLIFYQLSSTL